MSAISASVVMPLYGKRREVARAVRSVLAQGRADFELIVVDDGSTDGGAQVVAREADRRLRLLRQEHAGVSAARNRGIEAARAQIVAFCDADDEWEPGHLEALLALARSHPEAEVFATGYYRAGPDGRRRPNVLRGLAAGFESGVLADYFRLAAASEPPLHTSSVAVRVSALRAVGLFPQGVAAGEDLLTWARLAARFTIAYDRRPTAVFHRPAGIGERPERPRPAPDAVGEGLERLRQEAPEGQRPGLAAYVAHWHRMRGVIMLKLGRSGEARAEFARALQGGGWNARVAALWLLCVVPGAGRALEPLQRWREGLRAGAAPRGGGA